MHGDDAPGEPELGWATLLRAPNPGPMTLDGTNTWVLRAGPGDPAVVVDPGPGHSDHLTAVAGHAPIGAVLLTHGHPDHTDGVAELVERTGAPVRSLPVGQPVDLAGLRITGLATPGHTADSVCFLVEHDGATAVLTGDTILGRGTTVVAWPDGDLGDYLASLRQLAALPGVPVLPGHGPVLPDCAAAARRYLAHRESRLDQVAAAVAAGATTPADVVAAVYPDVDPQLREAAGWSVRAQLAYLARHPGAGAHDARGDAQRAAPPGAAAGVPQRPEHLAERRESAPGARRLDSP